MGLDITVHQLKKLNQNNFTNSKYFIITNLDKFPDWAKLLSSNVIKQKYDWDKINEIYNINIYDYNPISYNNDIFTFEHKTNKDANLFTIELKNFPTIKQNILIIGYDKIGYQRKGFNTKFYADYRNNKIGYFVWSKKELEKYMNTYCDSNEDKKRFKTNIIDKFVDGKCCVSFNW